MSDEYVFHVRLTERHAELLQVFCVTAQQCRLAPVKFGGQHESIKTVVLYLPTENA